MAMRVIPDADTAALWRLDELGAVTAVNIDAPGTHDGTPLNGCAGVDVSADNMPWENARQFVRASDQAIQVARHADLEPTNALSIGCWVKAVAVQSTIQMFVAKRDAGSPFEGYYLLINASGNGRLQAGIRTASAYRDVIGSDFSTYYGAWAFAVYTYDGQISRLYLNGELDNEVDHGSVAAIAHATPDLFLGGWPPYDATAKWYLDGYLAEPFVRSDVMTPWDIKQIVAAVRDPAAGFKS